MGEFILPDVPQLKTRHETARRGVTAVNSVLAFDPVRGAGSKCIRHLALHVRGGIRIAKHGQLPCSRSQTMPPEICSFISSSLICAPTRWPVTLAKASSAGGLECKPDLAGRFKGRLTGWSRSAPCGACKLPTGGFATVAATEPRRAMRRWLRCNRAMRRLIDDSPAATSETLRGFLQAGMETGPSKLAAFVSGATTFVASHRRRHAGGHCTLVASTGRSSPR